MCWIFNQSERKPRKPENPKTQKPKSPDPSGHVCKEEKLNQISSSSLSRATRSNCSTDNRIRCFVRQIVDLQIISQHLKAISCHKRYTWIFLILNLKFHKCQNWNKIKNHNMSEWRRRWSTSILQQVRYISCVSSLINGPNEAAEPGPSPGSVQSSISSSSNYWVSHVL